MNNYSLLLKMISKNGEKILNFLLRNCSYPGFNINQIAKEVDISIGSCFMILKELEKRRFLNKTALGNASFYRLNLEDKETFKLCEILLIHQRKLLSGYPLLYTDMLEKIDSKLIVLFGSILRTAKFNDVDVLFLTEKVTEIEKGCEKISIIRQKTVNPLLLTQKDLLKGLKENNPVLRNIIKEGVVLKGEDIFVDVIKNAACMVPFKEESYEKNHT